jgi:acyl carrier protein
MAIMAVIKDEFDVDLTIEEWKSLQTVDDVYNFIQIKLANR